MLKILANIIRHVIFSRNLLNKTKIEELKALKLEDLCTAKNGHIETQKLLREKNSEAFQRKKLISFLKGHPFRSLSVITFTILKIHHNNDTVLSSILKYHP